MLGVYPLGEETFRSEGIIDVSYYDDTSVG